MYQGCWLNAASVMISKKNLLGCNFITRNPAGFGFDI